MPAIDIQGNSLIELNPGKPAKQLPGMYALEPIKGYWSGNTNWGRGYKGDFPTTSGEQINMIRVPDMPGPPRARSIMLGRERTKYTSPTDISAANSGIRAKIIYGGGGITDTVYADWVNGTCITIVGTSVQVVAESYAIDLNQAYSVQAGQKLAISATMGVEASNSAKATFTNTYTQDAGQTVYVQIPPFATSVSFLAALGSPGTAGVVFYKAATVFPYTGTEIVALYGREIPLPGDVQLIRLTSGGSTAQWSVRFGLSI